jgi:hypothetical protein
VSGAATQENELKFRLQRQDKDIARAERSAYHPSNLLHDITKGKKQAGDCSP